MVHGSKTLAATKGTRSRPTSRDSLNPKVVLSERVDVNKTSKDGGSSSPSPAVGALSQRFGRTESLQRENLMRLRKQGTGENGLQNHTSGTQKKDRGATTSGGAKMSTVPGKVSSAQAELVRATQKAAAAAAKVSETSDAVSNGRVTKDAPLEPPPAAPVKFNVDFDDEESQSDNEILKKVMEDIENELDKGDVEISSKDTSSDDVVVLTKSDDDAKPMDAERDNSSVQTKDERKKRSRSRSSSPKRSSDSDAPMAAAKKQCTAATDDTPPSKSVAPCDADDAIPNSDSASNGNECTVLQTGDVESQQGTAPASAAQKGLCKEMDLLDVKKEAKDDEEPSILTAVPDASTEDESKPDPGPTTSDGGETNDSQSLEGTEAKGDAENGTESTDKDAPVVQEQCIESMAVAENADGAFVPEGHSVPLDVAALAADSEIIPADKDPASTEKKVDEETCDNKAEEQCKVESIKVEVQEKSVVTPRDEKVEIPSDKVATAIDEKAASPSDEKVATASDEKVATASDEKVASLSDEKVVTASDEKVGEPDIIVEDGTSSVCQPPSLKRKLRSCSDVQTAERAADESVLKKILILDREQKDESSLPSGKPLLDSVAGDNKENMGSVPSKEQEVAERYDKGRGRKEKTYRLSKAELEMLVMSKITEYFTDGTKSEIGALRRHCEQLEKALEQWRRKASAYQKQLTDLQIVLQRAQLNKRSNNSFRPPMRSVGLQVQLTRYIPVQGDSSKGNVSRAAAGASSKSLLIPSSSNASSAMASSQKLVIPKQSGSSGLAFVSSLGSAGSLGGTFISAKPSPAGYTTVASRRPLTTPTSLPPSMLSRPITEKAPGNQVGISLLQPKSSLTTSQAMATTLVFSAPIATPALGMSPLTVGTRTTSSTNLTGSSNLRPGLDTGKIISTGTPVPMRLVPNQAVRPTTSGPTTITVAPAKTTLVGQPRLANVKFVDLTADDDEQRQAAAAAAAAAGLTNSTSSATLTVVPSLNNSNAVTVLTPSTASNQILALSPSVVVGGNATGTLTTSAPIRMATPVRGATGPVAPIMSAAPMRLAYLMPSTSVVTMVRPNQSVFVAPAPVQRPGQPGVIQRPNIPTIVLQRGTTLVPIQQSQMTTLQPVRPASIVNTALLPSIPASTTIRPATTTTPAITSTQVVSSASRPAVSQGQSILSTAKSTVFGHPAALPAQPIYPELPTSTRKALPPKPALKISKVADGIVLSWNMSLNCAHAEVSSYQLFAYQEGSAAPNTSLWKKVGEVKALPLPMACTLTQFVEGHKYYFAVRAIDVHKRIGPFSDPGSIALMIGTTMKQTAIKS